MAMAAPAAIGAARNIGMATRAMSRCCGTCAGAAGPSVIGVGLAGVLWTGGRDGGGVIGVVAGGGFGAGGGDAGTGTGARGGLVDGAGLVGVGSGDVGGTGALVGATVGGGVGTTGGVGRGECRRQWPSRMSVPPTRRQRCTGPMFNSTRKPVEPVCAGNGVGYGGAGNADALVARSVPSSTAEASTAPTASTGAERNARRRGQGVPKHHLPVTRGS